MLPAADGLAQQIAFVAVSIPLTAVASGLDVGAGLGPGPRDGLMTGLHRRFGIPIYAARFSVEASVLLLGGTVGVATVLFAVMIGPLVHVALRRLSIAPPAPPAAPQPA